MKAEAISMAAREILAAAVKKGAGDGHKAGKGVPRFEMGPVAVPVLEDALKDKDVEVVFRAERILLRLNRPVP